MLAINAREAHLAIRNNLCPLSRRLFFKHGTLLQWIFSLADNTKLVVDELLDGTGFEPCEAPEKTFEEVLDLTASSTRDFGKVVLFIRSWASALSLSQAAKWINVGWYMSCLTV